MNYQNEYLNNFLSMCDVTDLRGNHCPEKVEFTITIDGKNLYLCAKCYKNFLESHKKGHYDLSRCCNQNA